MPRSLQPGEVGQNAAADQVFNERQLGVLGRHLPTEAIENLRGTVSAYRVTLGHPEWWLTAKEQRDYWRNVQSSARSMIFLLCRRVDELKREAGPDGAAVSEAQLGLRVIEEAAHRLAQRAEARIRPGKVGKKPVGVHLVERIAREVSCYAIKPVGTAGSPFVELCDAVFSAVGIEGGPSGAIAQYVREENARSGKVATPRPRRRNRVADSKIDELHAAVMRMRK